MDTCRGARIVRNAGGVITDAEVRSSVISRRLPGTREIILIHHTGCGMLTFTDDASTAQIEADTGSRPPWSPESFADPDDDVRQSMARIAANPFIPYKDSVRGFVDDVTDGSLREIHRPTTAPLPVTVADRPGALGRDDAPSGSSR